MNNQSNQSKYLHWKEIDISKDTDIARIPYDSEISKLYDQGFIFTRIAKGIMHQTRSLRIDLSKFNLTSENRRILKKTESHVLSPDSPSALPLGDYSWEIGKMAKDFYTEKFGDGVFSAQKIKELLTDHSKSNFNTLFRFNNPEGFAICYMNNSILHYSYPFYDLKSPLKDIGMGMMIRAINKAKELGLKYIYLGSLQRPNDTYKLQFEGLEWFNGENEKWETDLEKAKEILKQI